jgi:outer membrane receptor protein involved in Fe transport
MPAAAYGLGASLSPAGQYNGVFSGNTDLVPERANTFTVGAVFNPEEYVPGLQFSVDYWSIEIKDAILDNDAEFLITQCGATADPAFCGLINRNPVNGNLWVGNVVQVPGTQTFTGAFVDLTRVNIGFFDVAGLDLVGAYSHEISNYGSLDFTFRGTYVTKWDQQLSPGADIDDCQGQFGGSCGRPTPKWKHNFMSVWTTPWDLVFVGAWRMVGAVDEFNPNTAANSFGPADAGAEHYFDLTAEYTPQFIGIGETKLTVGVTNLTDNDPPVSGRFGNIATYGNGNTVPGTWDATGRYFFFALSQKF